MGIDMEKRIFRYTLADAWYNTISQVDVIDGIEKDNVRCLYFNTSGFLIQENNACIFTISKRAIDKIENVMFNHLDVLEYEEIEYPLVIDGVINIFEFALEGATANTIRTSNIWAFKEKDVVIDGDPPYKGLELLELYNEISKILIENGVDKKYLKLNY